MLSRSKISHTCAFGLRSVDREGQNTTNSDDFIFIFFFQIFILIDPLGPHGWGVLSSWKKFRGICPWVF